MWIAVIIVVLVVSLLLGPIMMMRPNKRQRRIAQLRALALKYDLRVRMTRMPDDAVRPGEAVALYYKAWPGGKPRRVEWVLARRSFAHGVHFLEDWDWSNDKVAPAHWHESLRQALACLPQSVVVIEASSHTLGLGWLEVLAGKSPDDAVDALNSWLESLMEQLAAKPATPSFDHDGSD